MAQERLPEPTTIINLEGTVDSIALRTYLEELIRVLRFNYDNIDGDLESTVGDLTTDAIPEGTTNLYYEDERVDDRVSNLLIEGVGIDLTYDDGADTLEIAAELATQAEAEAGILNTVLMTPLRSQQIIDANIPEQDYVELATASASASGTIEFGGMDATFPIYDIYFWDVVPATNNQLFRLRTSTDGATFDSGASDYVWGSRNVAVTTGAGTGSNVGDDAADYIGLLGGVTNGSGEGLSGRIRLYNPSGTALSKLIEVDTIKYGAAATSNSYKGFGVRAATADIEAVEFAFLAGAITSGEFVMYGRRG